MQDRDNHIWKSAETFFRESVNDYFYPTVELYGQGTAVAFSHKKDSDEETYLLFVNGAKSETCAYLETFKEALVKVAENELWDPEYIWPPDILKGLSAVISAEVSETQENRESLYEFIIEELTRYLEVHDDIRRKLTAHLMKYTVYM